MSLFDNLAEWVVSNTDSQLEDYSQTQQQVGAVQQQRNEDRYKGGTISPQEYYRRNDLIQDSKDATAEYQAKTGSVWHVLGGVPWYVWAALAGVAFWYLGGFVWVRNILAKR